MLRNYCLDSGGTKAVFLLECLSYFVKKSSSSMIYTRPNVLKLLSTEDDIISELTVYKLFFNFDHQYICHIYAIYDPDYAIYVASI